MAVRMRRCVFRFLLLKLMVVYRKSHGFHELMTNIGESRKYHESQLYCEAEEGAPP